ncbi:hypothetical protein BST61_g4156 [Cercospora zeina]
MKLLTTLATLQFAALGACAQYPAYSVFSTGEAPEDGYETFLAAGQMPRESHGISFDRSDSTPQGQNWTWTLQMTNVPMPNASFSNMDPPPNARVAFTTYSFEWPEGDNLNDAVRLSSLPVRGGDEGNSPPNSTSCIWLLFSAKFPQNVSDKWDPSSSDCTSALGADCVQAIRSGLSSSCRSSDFTSNSTFRESCADSFGAMETSWGTIAVPFGNSTDRNVTDVLTKGQTFAWDLSDPYAADNDTVLKAEKHRLHVIGLTVNEQIKSVSQLQSRQVLCNRATDRISSGAGSLRHDMMTLSFASVLAALFLIM